MNGAILRCSHRKQKHSKEIAQSIMYAERSWALNIERIYLCPIQAKTEISHRLPNIDDHFERSNLRRNWSSDLISTLSKSSHLVEDPGFVIVVKNWLPDGDQTSWEFHVASHSEKDFWLHHLFVAKSQSEMKEESNRLFFHELCEKIYRTVEVRDRSYLLKSYKKCFLGRDYANAICQELNCSMEDALLIGNEMLSFGLFTHVKQEHELLDANLFYNFCEKNIIQLLSQSSIELPRCTLDSEFESKAVGDSNSMQSLASAKCTVSSKKVTSEVRSILSSQSRGKSLSSYCWPRR